MPWLIETIREVAAGHARKRCLLGIWCAIVGHDDDPDAIVPDLGQCRRCGLNAPFGSAPRGWVPRCLTK